MQEKISGSLSRRLASPGRSYTTKESQKVGHRIYPSRSIVICCIRVYHFRNWPLLSHRAAAVGVVGFELNPANLAVNDVDIEMQNEPSSHNAEDYTAYLSHALLMDVFKWLPTMPLDVQRQQQQIRPADRALT